MDLKRIIGFLFRYFGFGLLLIALTFPAFADMAAAKRAYESGDYPTAFKEFFRLAEQGSAYAQSAVAYMYYRGWGVAKSSGEAARWCHAAAGQGEIAPQWLMPQNVDPDSFVAWRRLEEGKGTPKDYEEVARSDRLAADYSGPRCPVAPPAGPLQSPRPGVPAPPPPASP